jgi:hypothetical protein
MDALPHLGLYRRMTVLALIVAPALLLIDNSLHPKEYARGNEAQQLAETAAHATRWQVAHLFGFAAILVDVAAVLGLAFLVRRRAPLGGLVAGGMALVGLLGFAGAIVLDGFTWGILGELSGRAGTDQATVQTALHEVQQSGWSLPYYLTAAGFVLGFPVLAVLAARNGAVPGWAGALLALGALMVGTETLITSNAYFIAGAAVLLAGGIAVALPLSRMSDGEFARGGPDPAPV